MLKPTGFQKLLMSGLKCFQALPVKVKNIDMNSKFKTELKSYLRKKTLVRPKKHIAESFPSGFLFSKPFKWHLILKIKFFWK